VFPHSEVPANERSPRRVVTGLDSKGRSFILFDDFAKLVIWDAAQLPAENGGTADLGGGTFRFPTAGVEFVFTDFPPGRSTPMHATDTLDFIVIVSGSITFITETSETLLCAGNVLVDRGVMHAWRNDGDQNCRIVNVLCPATPVGRGATVAGVLDIS